MIKSEGVIGFLSEAYIWVLRKIWMYSGPRTGQPVYRDKFNDLAMLSGSRSPNIVDGGAHKGQSIDKFKNVFENPEIHSFEANPEKAKELSEKYGNDINIFNIALGPEEKEVELNITQKDSGTSVRKPTEEYIKSYGDRVSVNKTIPIKQKRLDDIIKNDINILKLDIQGYELQALIGAEKSLEKTNLILIETSIHELYDGQSSFCEINNFLNDKDFELFNIYDHKVMDDGRLADFDAIYHKSE